MNLQTFNTFQQKSAFCDIIKTNITQIPTDHVQIFACVKLISETLYKTAAMHAAGFELFKVVDIFAPLPPPGMPGEGKYDLTHSSYETFLSRPSRVWLGVRKRN